MYIVVEVIMNMAEYTSSWQSAAGAAEERQYLNQQIVSRGSHWIMVRGKGAFVSRP